MHHVETATDGGNAGRIQAVLDEIRRQRQDRDMGVPHVDQLEGKGRLPSLDL
jgi:hypothetical protein